MLAFDPKLWLEDNRSQNECQSVATVATVAAVWSQAENLKVRKKGAVFRQSDSIEAGPDFSILPRASATPATPATPDTASGWRNCLAKLDRSMPPEDFHHERWKQLHDDARWLLENHGNLAAQLGWTSADLFGIKPDKPHWGGIADCLKGSRSLVMNSDRASWLSWGQEDHFNRGSYPDLQPLWEVSYNAP